MTADTRFALPAVDSSPLAETGVVLLGLDAPRLLAGLAVAESADDPALVALAVDEARHGVTGRAAFGGLVAAGAVRWRTARGTLAAAGAPVPASASLRQAFARALDVLANVLANVLPDAGLPDGAGRAYLDRSVYRPGMAVRGGLLVKAFAAVGWTWGGTAFSSPDYQHFSRTGG